MQPQQYVGIDRNRRRSVIVRMSAEGEKLSCVRLPNDPVEVATEIAKAGEGPEVVIEATYGWYWLVDLLQQQGAKVHLAHPSGLNGKAGGPSSPPIHASPPDGATRSPAWRRRASSSPWSITACETARSVAWPRRGDKARARPGREL